jgi:hypothetical protein
MFKSIIFGGLLDAKSKILKFPNYGNVTEGHRLHYDA